MPCLGLIRRSAGTDYDDNEQLDRRQRPDRATARTPADTSTASSQRPHGSVAPALFQTSSRHSLRLRRSAAFQQESRHLEALMPRLEDLTDAARQGHLNLPAFEHDDSPFAPLRKPLSEAKVALVTTAGLHLRETGPSTAAISPTASSRRRRLLRTSSRATRASGSTAPRSCAT